MPTLQVKDANGVTQTINTINANGAAVPASSQPVVGTIIDPISLAGATVTQFHNLDNQALGTSNGIYTGGVAQIVNGSGTLDRQRETGFDGVPATGISSGAQQMASAPLNSTITTTISSTGSQTVTLAASTLTVRGITYTIQVGQQLLVDTGTNQETVIVTAVPSGTTITANFTKTHAGSVVFKTFWYDQARSSTIADSSTPQGIPANTAFFWNSALNAGSGGLEIERSAAGELDGASGSGTNIAAEFEWNGGGPIAFSTGLATGFQFDRARSVQAKGIASQAITSTIAGNTTIILSGGASASNTLTAGQKIRLTGSGTSETVLAVNSTVSGGSATITLQSAVVNTGQTNAQWDIYAVDGPGVNGFLADGVGIEEEALYDPVSKLFYIERSATQDNVVPQNVVMESPAMWNGTGMDREYNNWNTITGDSGAKTSAFTGGATQINFNHRGAYITCVTSAVSGNFTIQLQWSPDAGTTWLALGPATTAVTTPNTVTLDVYPTNFSTSGASPAALTTGAAQTTQLNLPLPRTWRVLYSIGTSATITGTYVNYIL